MTRVRDEKCDLGKDLDEKNKAHGFEKFRMGILPFDPLFVYIAIIYGFTRILEWVFGTERFWERLWVGFVEYVDVSEYDFIVWVTSAAILLLFWTVTLLYLYLDFSGSLQRYKVQPGKNEPVERRKILESLFTVLFNQIFISITYSSGGYWLSYLMLGDRDMRDVSSFPIMMRDLLIAHQCFDSGFFFFHKIMHSKYFYKRLHKIHHEWKAPICITALYAHPTEHLIANLLPTMIGPVLTQTPISTLWIWLSSIAISTISDHSGYHLPFLKSPEFHDHHHVTFTENFGTCGVTDFIFKTSVKFRQSINFKRHRVLLSLKSSVRELYPKRDVKLSDKHKE